MKIIGSEFDNFYLLGLKSYLKKYRVSDVENFPEFCLKKTPQEKPTSNTDSFTTHNKRRRENYTP